jgi:hypothetical protein
LFFSYKACSAALIIFDAHATEVSFVETEDGPSDVTTATILKLAPSGWLIGQLEESQLKISIHIHSLPK